MSDINKHSFSPIIPFNGDLNLCDMLLRMVSFTRSASRYLLSGTKQDDDDKEDTPVVVNNLDVVKATGMVP
jgi:hypothetical protein